MSPGFGIDKGGGGGGRERAGEGYKMSSCQTFNYKCCYGIVFQCIYYQIWNLTSEKGPLPLKDNLKQWNQHISWKSIEKNGRSMIYSPMSDSYSIWPPSLVLPLNKLHWLCCLSPNPQPKHNREEFKFT